MIKFLILKLLGPIDYRFYVPEILGLMKELLWPVTLLLVVLIFRREISKLIGRIKNILETALSDASGLHLFKATLCV